MSEQEGIERLPSDSDMGHGNRRGIRDRSGNPEMTPSDVVSRTTDSVRLQRYRDWGVFPGPWLWGQKLRILYVIDGLITPMRDVDFALGHLTEILLDPAFAWWVDFEVTVAQRAPAPPFPRPGEVLQNPSAGPYEVRYRYFRFDQAGFDIDAYDQVWLFGYQPGNDGGPDANVGLAKNTPLTDAELKVLAHWMDAGGGVFATGDHAYLGASMCSRIPRVRTMRKWTHAQGVPLINGPGRLDTNQPRNPYERANIAKMDFYNQSDAVPQPIEVVMEPLVDLIPWLRSYSPHPILCTRAGIIDRFPDHPHEGEVIADDEVRLDEPLGIPGYPKPEYPGGAGRPTPKVIAYGRTTHRQWKRTKGFVSPRRFGLVGAYDGDPVGIGRVVVDSTWHHWMSENLWGFETNNPEMMTLMAAYYRNVALWLATPQQRAAMLAAATWGVLMGAGQMQFPITASIWELGERARDVIGRTASQCTISKWVGQFFDSRVFGSIELPDPCLTCPPGEVFEHAILGGIAKGMLQVAFPYQEEMAIQRRPVPDPDAIAAAALEGARLGHEELVRSLNVGAATLSEIASAAAEGYREHRVPPPDLRLTSVRVVVDEVTFADPFDPALANGTTTIHLRLEIDGRVLARTTIERIEVAEPGRRGAAARLDAELGEVTVWVGSQLSVVAAAERSGPVPVPHEARGTLTLTGDPRTWLGVHRTLVDSTDRWLLAVSITETTPAA